jgi:hypothetical protein
MEKLTQSQLLALHIKILEYNEDVKYLRQGQLTMNALFHVSPEMYNAITGTDADCFYDDKKLHAFWKRVTP